jgi:hypothetical protein
MRVISKQLQLVVGVCSAWVAVKGREYPYCWSHEVGPIDILLAPVTAAVKSILKPLVVVYISEFIEF